MRFALVGQPNCGKSTLFNQVAGYKAETGNFSGTTVTYTESKVRVLGEVIELVDLPGTYTLTASNPAEQEVLRYLSFNPVDVVINVLDASHLAQSLNLSMEVLELGRPTVLALNMMDEAARFGMTINGPKLQELLGVPVLPLVASRGRGVRAVFTTALQQARQGEIPPRPKYSRDLERHICSLADQIEGGVGSLGPESVAIKLLEGSEKLWARQADILPDLREEIEQAQESIEEQRGHTPLWAFDTERKGLASRLTNQVVTQGERRVTFRDRLDDILLHPVWGYVALIAILWAFFRLVYSVGSLLEGPLLTAFDTLALWLSNIVSLDTFWGELLNGTVQGIAGGVAIVLPYLVPFLLGMGFLEDVGYLSRLAFLMDALMHRLGLHGKAIVPFILGYGCNVPAVMSTRVLEERQDRFLAATIASLVPCAARISVVFGLVAFYLGPRLAALIYLFNLIVIALVGRLMSLVMTEKTPGLIIEIPVYRLPTLKTVFHKTWFRAREFIVDAWPLLIIGSIVLEVFNRFNISRWLNLALRPFTWLLGLPSAVGIPLIFGVLRKELSLIMLRQALDVTDFSQALSPVQMITFTVFIVFYLPCVATLMALRRELGGKDAARIAGLTVVVAMVTALMARGVSSLFY